MTASHALRLDAVAADACRPPAVAERVAPATPLRCQTVRVGAQTLRIVDLGAADAARTVLLFNGIGTRLETAAPFIGAFRHTRVIAFDAPGVGASPAPLLPYRLNEVARLAEALLDHLGVAVADVVGVSWGGAVAQEFALRHPQRCTTLTLAASWAGLVMVPMPAATPVAWLGRLMRLGQDVLRVHAAGLPHPGHRGHLYQMLALWGWTSWHRLHRVDLPTLVLMAADDPLVPQINGHLVASRLSRATLETVSGGHLFALTRPDETARRIEGFFAAHPLLAEAG